MVFNNVTADVKKLLESKSNEKLFTYAREANKQLRMHMYGDGLDVKLQTITGFETATLKKLRTEYARSNKDLFSRLGEPMLEVFTARGGSVNYNLSDAPREKVHAMLDDVYGGYSLKKWTQTWWLPHYKDDPNGVILIEVASKKDIPALKAAGKALAYPCYKSVNDIIDYGFKNGNLDYLILNVADRDKTEQGLDIKKQYYRVIDDAYDYYLLYADGNLTQMADHTYANIFGHVPARLCSDLPDSKCDDLMLSPFYYITELADHFLVKGSLKMTHDFRHAFPKYFEYADDCTDCKATGYQGAEICKTCKGSGKKLMLHVSDVKVLTYPEDKDTPIVTPNVAGYISPDKTFWEIATSDISDLEVLMKATIWGMDNIQRAAGPDSKANKVYATTATEALMNSKPKINKLITISTSAERIDKFIMDHIIIASIDKRYKGGGVSYGRRYNLEGPDEIWLKYENARAKGAPISALNDLLREYYNVQYAEDSVKLNNMVKLMRVEPFLHITLEVLITLNPNPEDYTAKLYYSNWLANKSDSEILIMKIEALQKDLYTFIKDKIVEPPKPSIPPINQPPVNA